MCVCVCECVCARACESVKTSKASAILIFICHLLSLHSISALDTPTIRFAPLSPVWLMKSLL